jgi:hypothetical protein
VVADRGVVDLKGTSLIAIPIVAGALDPSFGLMLRPELGALAMSTWSITVVSNALLWRREVSAYEAESISPPDGYPCWDNPDPSRG